MYMPIYITRLLLKKSIEMLIYRIKIKREEGETEEKSKKKWGGGGGGGEENEV